MFIFLLHFFFFRLYFYNPDRKCVSLCQKKSDRLSTSVSQLSLLNSGQMLGDVKNPTYQLRDCRHSQNTLFHSFFAFLPCPLFLSHYLISPCAWKKLWASAAMATSPNRRRGLSLQKQQVIKEEEEGKKMDRERTCCQLPLCRLFL